MQDVYKQLLEYQEIVNQQKEEISRRIVGLPSFLESLFICFYSHSEGKLVPHLLVEGAVGTGKTAALETFASTISDMVFKRVQFTADLKPRDLLIEIEREAGEFVYYPGPLIANLVLADEINRAPEKTRSALLEIMGEEQYTIGRKTHLLKRPFFVMATQNPIDIEGTFLLGAAQLDRFMMKVYMEPLSEKEDIQIAVSHHEKAPEIKPVLSREKALDIRDFIRGNIFISPEVRRNAVRIVRALREGQGLIPRDNWEEEYNFLPWGSRGYQFLERGTKVKAFLEGRNYVILDDIESLAFSVLNHRVEFKYSGNARDLISKAIEKVRENEAEGL